MKLPTIKYGILSEREQRGQVNPWGTLAAYAGVLLGTFLTILIIVEIGYGLGFWPTSCSLNSGQPKCHNWRNVRADQHIGGNLNLRGLSNNGR